MDYGKFNKNSEEIPLYKQVLKNWIRNAEKAEAEAKKKAEAEAEEKNLRKKLSKLSSEQLLMLQSKLRIN